MEEIWATGAIYSQAEVNGKIVILPESTSELVGKITIRRVQREYSFEKFAISLVEREALKAKDKIMFSKYEHDKDEESELPEFAYQKWKDFSRFAKPDFDYFADVTLQGSYIGKQPITTSVQILNGEHFSFRLKHPLSESGKSIIVSLTEKEKVVDLKSSSVKVHGIVTVYYDTNVVHDTISQLDEVNMYMNNVIFEINCKR